MRLFFVLFFFPKGHVYEGLETLACTPAPQLGQLTIAQEIPEHTKTLEHIGNYRNTL